MSRIGKNPIVIPEGVKIELKDEEKERRDLSTRLCNLSERERERERAGLGRPGLSL